MKLLGISRITPGLATVNDIQREVVPDGKGFLHSLYTSLKPDYPKFFKMDLHCKLGFLATELLLEGTEGRFEPREDRAVVAFTHNGCLQNDLEFNAGCKAENYFPSPALFVYTLPNIVTGEICIRNRYKGDSSCFVLPNPDREKIQECLECVFQDPVTTSALCTWVDYKSEEDYEAYAFLIENK
ncbi:MAG: hypothetical protein J5764_06550 [Bacteroidales bacterium]|nr:hypothetical protein [Bacteroidales bacterium]